VNQEEKTVIVGGKEPKAVALLLGAWNGKKSELWMEFSPIWRQVKRKDRVKKRVKVPCTWKSENDYGRRGHPAG